jgi:adenylate kinase
MFSITTPDSRPRPPIGARRPMRRLLLVGPPGAGKSSQGVQLAARLGVNHVSTGALLREEMRRESPIGMQAASYVTAGRLVPDWLVLYAVELYLSDALADGFVLDGYPRTLEQAERFTRSLGCTQLDRVIELAISDEVALSRLAGRSVCDRCGPGESDSTTMCARCGGPVQRRADDDELIVRSRLETYRTQTEPMLDYFRALGCLAVVDGSQPRERVGADLFRALDFGRSCDHIVATPAMPAATAHPAAGKADSSSSFASGCTNTIVTVTAT